MFGHGAVVAGPLGLVVVAPAEEVAGMDTRVEVASHLVQIVEVVVMMTVEVETPVSMLVVPPVVWVFVTGQRVVDVMTLERN